MNTLLIYWSIKCVYVAIMCINSLKIWNLSTGLTVNISDDVVQIIGDIEIWWMKCDIGKFIHSWKRLPIQIFSPGSQLFSNSNTLHSIGFLDCLLTITDVILTHHHTFLRFIFCILKIFRCSVLWELNFSSNVFVCLSTIRLIASLLFKMFFSVVFIRMGNEASCLSTRSDCFLMLVRSSLTSTECCLKPFLTSLTTFSMSRRSCLLCSRWNMSYKTVCHNRDRRIWFLPLDACHKTSVEFYFQYLPYLKDLQLLKYDVSLTFSCSCACWNMSHTCFPGIPYRRTKLLLCIVFQSDTRRNSQLRSSLMEIQPRPIFQQSSLTSTPTTLQLETLNFFRHIGQGMVSPFLLPLQYCSMHFRQNVWKQGNILGLQKISVHIEHSVMFLTVFTDDLDAAISLDQPAQQLQPITFKTLMLNACIRKRN